MIRKAKRKAKRKTKRKAKRNVKCTDGSSSANLQYSEYGFTISFHYCTRFISGSLYYVLYLLKVVILLAMYFAMSIFQNNDTWCSPNMYLLSRIHVTQFLSAIDHRAQVSFASQAERLKKSCPAPDTSQTNNQSQRLVRALRILHPVSSALRSNKNESLPESCKRRAGHSTSRPTSPANLGAFKVEIVKFRSGLLDFGRS